MTVPCVADKLSDDDRDCRLEAATSRLEDLAALGSGGGSQTQLSTSGPTQSSEPTPVPPPPPPPPAAAAASTLEEPASYVAYNEIIIDGKLKPFLELTRSFGSDSVIEQVRMKRSLLKSSNLI